MKTVYVCRTVDGIKLYENIFEGYTLIGTIEVQEPPKEKKWVKREIKMSDCPLGIKFNNLGTYVPLPSEYRNAVLTYEVLEDDNAETK